MLFVQDCFAQASEGLKGVKPPVGIPFSPVLLGLIIIVLIIFLAVIIWRILKAKKKKIPVVEILPAHVIALQRLQELESKNLPAQGKIKEYYSILSDIVRHYLEERFSLRAPEMTTEEFLLLLKESASLAVDHKALLKDFLSSCDLVKFAKYGPDPHEIAHSFVLARKMIEETKDVEHSV